MINTLAFLTSSSDAQLIPAASDLDYSSTLGLTHIPRLPQYPPHITRDPRPVLLPWELHTPTAKMASSCLFAFWENTDCHHSIRLKCIRPEAVLLRMQEQGCRALVQGTTLERDC